MDLNDDPIAIVGTSCRLPCGINKPSQLWDVFCNGEIDVCTSTPPESRSTGSEHSPPIAGWLSPDGVEDYDPAFFNITPAEAETLRPNIRLALELTWEALEHAGIPPSSLRGKNISVSVGMGTEDGWDLKRYGEEGSAAFDHHWAASSDPSGVAGRVAHFFDFHGASSSISTGCSSAAFALRDGISNLCLENCDMAVVGAVTTHFYSAAFDWARSVHLLSAKGRCSAFSEDADGYVPSEGAVFLILTKHSLANANGLSPLGLIRAIATGHNGATRALAIPNVQAQAALSRRSFAAGRITPSDVVLLEAHGTGTRLGDAMEMEAVRSVYEGDRNEEDPLWVSSSKTRFGHCQASAAFVGILKVLACFEHGAIPPHHVTPLAEYTRGPIHVSPVLTPVNPEKRFVAQVSSFGFTGSNASIIMEAPSRDDGSALAPPLTPPIEEGEGEKSLHVSYLLPFSARSEAALKKQMSAVRKWAKESECGLRELGAMLALGRDHFSVRRAVLARQADSLEDLLHDTLEAEDRYLGRTSGAPDCEAGHCDAATLNLEQLDRSRLSRADAEKLEGFLSVGNYLEAACLLFENGHTLQFGYLYSRRNLDPVRMQSLPTYPFERKRCFRSKSKVAVSPPATEPNVAQSQQETHSARPSVFSPSHSRIEDILASILNTSAKSLPRDASIFDLGVDSLNSIELAATLTRTFGATLTSVDLYRLLTIEAIHEHFVRAQAQGIVGGNSRFFSQEELESWIEAFGTPLVPRDVPKIKTESSSRTVLLTGANGMLGCHLLARLLANPTACVICLVRGDAWARLSDAFVAHGYSADVLAEARDSGSLVALHTSDLGHERLGITEAEYALLEESVDTILHGAWKLDFNLAVAGFRSCIGATRQLAQLAASARHEVVFHFISSFSSSLCYTGELVPEELLEPRIEHCLPQGYAVAKLIAEHALDRIVKNDQQFFRLNIIRVGQICGHSATGKWAKDELVPMLIASIPTLKAVLSSVPDASWIPSDVCADTLCDFVFEDSATLDSSIESSPQPPVRVLNVANPHIVRWADVVRMIGFLSGLGELEIVPVAEYARRIREASECGAVPAIARLLPYFLAHLDDGGFPDRYCSLEVKETLKSSKALRGCPKITEELLMPILKHLLHDVGVVEAAPESMVLVEWEPPVLMFGPWAAGKLSAKTARSRDEVLAGITKLASKVREQIGYSEIDNSLERQLETLAGQLSVVRELKKRDVSPVAVVGYCFGEYAASITAGILSEETAVDVIVRRAVALRDAKGTMLNVFADIMSVRRGLVCLVSPPDIAIIAGPTHIVLSGSHESITAAQSELQKRGLKARPVDTTLPFHSSVMDEPVRQFNPPGYKPSSGTCVYVSGVTGKALPGERLGPKYWTRHIREPVRFLASMEYVRKTFSGSPLVDVGPGIGLLSTVSRYGWDGFQLMSTEDYLSIGGPKRAQSRRASQPTRHAHAPLHTAPVPTKAANASSGTVNDVPSALATATSLLNSLFGYQPTMEPLRKSFHSLGIQSLDFVRFSELFAERTGIMVPASSFASDATIEDVLGDFV